MPGWFIALLLFSLVGFLASWSGDLVLATSIVSLGLMVPVWFIAANLWWVLLALIPFMVMRAQGRGAVGLAIGAGAVVALGVGASVKLEAARAALTPALPLPAPGLALKAGTPGSVELFLQTSHGWDAGEEACGQLCRALLTGGDIRWFRLRIAGPERSEVVFFARSERDFCLTLDPAFPADAPCLHAQEDSGDSADLRIEITEEGDFHGPLKSNHGAVYLTGIQRLILKDNRVTPPQMLDQRLRYGWSQPVIGPLVPAMTALGSGRKNDGPGFNRDRRQSDPFDLAAVLAHAGLRLGPVPVAVGDGGPPPVPVNTALLASILALDDDGLLTRGQSIAARDWVMQFNHSPLAVTAAPKVGEAERKVFRQLAKLQGDPELARILSATLGEHPEYLVEDFGALLRLIVIGTPEEVQMASRAAHFGLFRAKRGEHDAAWPDYVAAIESGRSTETLIRWVGRFNHDPIPLLQPMLAEMPRDQSAWAALSAVCHIEQRWWPALVPLVQDAAMRGVPSAGTPDFNGTALMEAMRVLVFMGRRDLADDVMGRIDWSLVQDMPDWADSPGSAERFREAMLEGLDTPLGC